MNQRPDDGLRALLRQNLSVWRGSPVHWVTIETGLTQGGVPDLHGTCRGAATWVECKSTDAWAVSVRTLQVGFARTQHRCGGRLCFVTRRRPSAANSRGEDEVWWCPGEEIQSFCTLGLRSPGARLLGVGGPSCWDWDRLGLAIFG